MTDVMSPEQRSHCMAAIKSKNTKPEIIVRKFLFSKGLRYRLNNRRLPGTPDIVLKKYKTVVFIDGCFWHGHEGCRYAHLPKTNVKFWKHKIAMNKARDYANGVDLDLAGWRVIRIWECEIKTKAKREERLGRLYREIIGTEYTRYQYGLTTDTDSSTTESGSLGSNSGYVAADPPAPYG